MADDPLTQTSTRRRLVAGDVLDRVRKALSATMTTEQINVIQEYSFSPRALNRLAETADTVSHEIANEFFGIEDAKLRAIEADSASAVDLLAHIERQLTRLRAGFESSKLNHLDVFKWEFAAQSLLGEFSAALNSFTDRWMSQSKVWKLGPDGERSHSVRARTTARDLVGPISEAIDHEVAKNRVDGSFHPTMSSRAIVDAVVKQSGDVETSRLTAAVMRQTANQVRAQRELGSKRAAAASAVAPLARIWMDELQRPETSDELDGVGIIGSPQHVIARVIELANPTLVLPPAVTIDLAQTIVN